MDKVSETNILCFNLPISIFGILFNLINVLVFSHKTMRNSLVNWLLLALTVTDLTLIIANFFFAILPYLHRNSEAIYAYIHM